MLTTLDYIIIFFFTFFFYTGFKKGLFRILLGPISLIIATVAAFIYYQTTEKVLISLLIGIFGPFAIKLILSLWLKLFGTTVKSKDDISMISRVSGGACNLAWNGAIYLMVVVLVVVLPGNIPWLNKMQDHVFQSKTYSVINKLTDNKLPSQSLDVKGIAETLNDPEQRKRLEKTPEYKQVMDHKNFKSFMRDREVQKLLEDKNYTALISNPKFQEILEDKALVEDLFSLNNRILKESLEKKEGE